MYRFLISLKTLNARIREELGKFCRKHRNVNFLTKYLGDWDYENWSRSRNAREILQILAEFNAEFGDVLNHTRVFQVFEFPKLSNIPFRGRTLAKRSASNEGAHRKRKSRLAPTN